MNSGIETHFFCVSQKAEWAEDSHKLSSRRPMYARVRSFRTSLSTPRPWHNKSFRLCSEHTWNILRARKGCATVTTDCVSTEVRKALGAHSEKNIIFNGMQTVIMRGMETHFCVYADKLSSPRPT